MAKYGLYNAGGKSILNEWEADEMIQNGSHVFLYSSKGGGKEQVVAIQLVGPQIVARTENVTK